MATQTEQQIETTGHKSVLGVVVSDKMDKSIVVRLDRSRLHPRYRKVMRLTKKVHVHDERNEAREGDTVSFVACRPMSKTKTWRLVQIVERAK